MKTKQILLALCVFCGLIFGPLVAEAQQKPIEITSGTVLPQPLALSPFQLTGTNGQPFTNQSLMGHWTFLFFGFTNCGYVCPTTMVTIKKIYANLKTNNQTLPQVVLISIDPVRDTPER